MTNIIDSLKRLERAGGENSRQTEKLVAAATQLARHLLEILPTGELPRGYKVYERAGKRHLEVSYANCFVWLDDGYLNRQQALDFARDIAGGWIGEVGEQLDAEGAVTTAALATLERAAAAMRDRGDER